MKGMSLTHTRLRAAVRVMRYYNSVPLLGAVQTTSLLVVVISKTTRWASGTKEAVADEEK